MHSRIILTAEEMRAAEANAVRGGISEAELMRRAGEAAAHAVRRFAGPLPVLVLAGPGNNGGDGYVLAQSLAGQGMNVRVAALGQPMKSPAKQAASTWKGEVLSPSEAQAAPVFVDALFGTGLKRPVGGEAAAAIERLAAGASLRIALDLPSGVSADDGVLLSPIPDFDMTVAFGALKPAHLLYPAAAKMGRLVVADIGLDALPAGCTALSQPAALALHPAGHKYSRGHVAVVAGAMGGAAWLAARAAQRAGAGYVTVAGVGDLPPSSLVTRPLDDVAFEKIDAVVLGPGLGRTGAAKQVAERLLSCGRPIVIDADMFTLFADDPQPLFGRGDVMTPHHGEFIRLFGKIGGSKIEQARTAARRSGNVVVLKGPDTVIAAPDGRAAVNDHAHPRLATLGTGDVLCGIIAAERARGRGAFNAACAAVWRHGDAALRGADGLIAEDLLELL